MTWVRRMDEGRCKKLPFFRYISFNSPEISSFHSNNMFLIRFKAIIFYLYSITDPHSRFSFINLTSSVIPYTPIHLNACFRQSVFRTHQNSFTLLWIFLPIRRHCYSYRHDWNVIFCKCHLFWHSLTTGISSQIFLSPRIFHGWICNIKIWEVASRCARLVNKYSEVQLTHHIYYHMN
jgi:hypothetical protein